MTSTEPSQSAVTAAASSTAASHPEDGAMPRSFSSTSTSSSSVSASASSSAADPASPTNTQSFQHIFFLHPIRLTLFTILHGVYAFGLLLYDAWNWTSPADAASQALAIGKAVTSAADEQQAQSSGSIQIPKHVALVLQTPSLGLPPSDTENDQLALGGEVAAQAYEEAERLAVESLRLEVRKVAAWCDQLGVGTLTVMDTGGLLAKAGLQDQLGAETSEKRGAALQNGSSGQANGSSHIHVEDAGEREQQSNGKPHMRKRPKSRLRGGANGSAQDPGDHDGSAHTAASSPTSLSLMNGNDAPSSSTFDLSTLSIRTRVLSPTDGDDVFAQTAEIFRLELERKVDEKLALRKDEDVGEDERAVKVKREKVDDDGWTEVHGRQDSLPQSEEDGDESWPTDDVDSIRAEMLEWIDKITVSRVDEALLEHGYVSEPDFLILHGVPKRAVQLYGFPAWAVRLTEIFHDPLADPRRPITLTTFVRAIKYFNRVQQRFGK
ncbi:hypothetical protein A4X13_0g1796 [Tilletia indica]|uniref:ditrans,polycis-polyprenyl diphosphate synthase [(2E,6E)-farnesyldiphosphate specific] n=1 Tax=Tilletia indica TaxID=43049 RepID=A0A177TNL3_9BASI|nr:hypothetical protein A4X13_0g1796 [Tilletia indica]